MLEDYRSAPIEPGFSELLCLIEKIARNASAVTREDIDTVRSAGWGDEAIYDAITVCALFNFYTTWVDASGVPSLPDYAPSGERLAADGYLPKPPSQG